LFKATNNFLTGKEIFSLDNSSNSILSCKLAVIDFLSLFENLSKCFNKSIESNTPGVTAINVANCGY